MDNIAFKPVSRTTLSEQVAVQLASELEAKRWKPGEKLPSEAELCRAFNVGRSTLREALKSLSFIGLIRMRPGGGSYVAETRSKYMGEPLFTKGVLNSEKEITDFSEARLMLETELAGLCAQRATDEDLELLQNLVDEMKPAIYEDPARFRQLDLRFHLAVAAGSKNRVLAQLLKHVRQALLELITKSLLRPVGMEMAWKQHAEVLQALKERNSAKARRAMRGHLRSFQRGYKVLFHAPAANGSQRKKLAPAVK